jgi:single stranded DNA-binding protein
MEEQKKKKLINTRQADEGDFGNTISFVGNLGQDPKMIYTPEAKAKTTFSCGVWAGKGVTLWLNCAVWEELAEEAAESLKKGMRVKIVGRLRSYMWQGVKNYEVFITRIEILTKKSDLPVTPHVDEDKEAAWRVAHNLDEPVF